MSELAHFFVGSTMIALTVLEYVSVAHLAPSRIASSSEHN